MDLHDSVSDSVGWGWGWSDPMHNERKLPGFDEYVSRLEQRLRVGEQEYGNRSFQLAPEATLDEIEQELLDISGWGYVAWRRLRALRAALDEKLRRAKSER